MTTATKVSVGMNNQVFADEAASQLGCSYSHIANLLRTKKINGQKVEGRWMVDYDDLQRAKGTRLVKPRKNGYIKSPVTTAPAASEETVIKLNVPKAKFDLIRVALAGSDKSLVKYLLDHVDKLHDQIQKKLSTVDV